MYICIQISITMTLKNKFAIILLSMSLPFTVLTAQNSIKLENYIYDEDIFSVKLCALSNCFSLPVLTLGTAQQLQLTFDDLSEGGKYLRYDFIHCSHDWKPSDMARIEYIDGFEDAEIRDYAFAVNTIVPYTRYTLNFPNDEMRITKSGNYILFVYDYTKNQPILTRRFFVKENTPCSITAKVRRASNPEFSFTKQQVEFWVNTGAYNIPNPQRDLRATIIQNSRWDNAIIGLTYRSGGNGNYAFNYDDGRNCFWGGNSFRYFSTRSLRTNGEFVQNINFQNRENEVYLFPEKPRPYGAYEEKTTLYGRCFYANDDLSVPNSEDYVWVNFALTNDAKWQNGDIYVMAELTDWRYLPEAKLVFNPQSNLWETTLLLKQGFYNYQYLFLPNGGKTGIESVVEGNHWEAGNEYGIIAYLREEGSIYDKIIEVLMVYTLERW